ncbi:MAG: hypothetical protein LQ350_008723, partial [Teloschistes chrysophthalmus]
MCAFAFHNAYPKAGDVSMDEGDGEQTDFDIDSDASDADLLELKQELNKLGPGKTRRDLADATIAAQEITLQRWKRFFKGYLIWYHKTHPRARRLNTYESVWKSLRQLYYDTCYKVVAHDVGKEIINFLHGQFCSDRGLVKGMRHKPVVGHNGLHGALYYHWKFDTATFTLELERVELALGLLFLAFTGARPGAIFESGCKGIVGTNAALLYKDVKLRLLQPPDEVSLLVLEVTIMLDKGKRKRNAPKTITLYENHTCPAMCPILHFVAIAFAHNAFHPRLVSAGLNPYSLHNFSTPDGRITIDFTFRDDILEIPIFRCLERSIEGIHVHPFQALSANSISQWTKRLGERAGFDHPFQPYALRREVGTELT